MSAPYDPIGTDRDELDLPYLKMLAVIAGNVLLVAAIIIVAGWLVF